MLSEQPFIPKCPWACVVSPAWNSQGLPHRNTAGAKSEDTSHSSWSSDLLLLPCNRKIENLAKGMVEQYTCVAQCKMK